MNTIKIKIEAMQESEIGVFLTRVFFDKVMTIKATGEVTSFKELMSLVAKHSLRAYEGGYHLLYLEDTKENLLDWCKLVKETALCDLQEVEQAILKGKTNIRIRKDS